jgi:hypothetical protein
MPDYAPPYVEQQAPTYVPPTTQSVQAAPSYLPSYVGAFRPLVRPGALPPFEAVPYAEGVTRPGQQAPNIFTAPMLSETGRPTVGGSAPTCSDPCVELTAAQIASRIALGLGVVLGAGLGLGAGYLLWHRRRR